MLVELFWQGKKELKTYVTFETHSSVRFHLPEDFMLKY